MQLRNVSNCTRMSKSYDTRNPIMAPCRKMDTTGVEYRFQDQPITEGSIWQSGCAMHQRAREEEAMTTLSCPRAERMAPNVIVAPNQGAMACPIDTRLTVSALVLLLPGAEAEDAIKVVPPLSPLPPLPPTYEVVFIPLECSDTCKEDGAEDGKEDGT